MARMLWVFLILVVGTACAPGGNHEKEMRVKVTFEHKDWPGQGAALILGSPDDDSPDLTAWKDQVFGCFWVEEICTKGLVKGQKTSLVTHIGIVGN